MSKAKEKAECIRVGKGTVYQKSPGGTFYYRYQIHKKRKAISLQVTLKGAPVSKLLFFEATEVNNTEVFLKR